MGKKSKKNKQKGKQPSPPENKADEAPTSPPVAVEQPPAPIVEVVETPRVDLQQKQARGAPCRINDLSPLHCRCGNCCSFRVPLTPPARPKSKEPSVSAGSVAVPSPQEAKIKADQQEAAALFAEAEAAAAEAAAHDAMRGGTPPSSPNAAVPQEEAASQAPAVRVQIDDADRDMLQQEKLLRQEKKAMEDEIKAVSKAAQAAELKAAAAAKAIALATAEAAEAEAAAAVEEPTSLDKKSPQPSPPSAPAPTTTSPCLDEPTPPPSAAAEVKSFPPPSLASIPEPSPEFEKRVRNMTTNPPPIRNTPNSEKQVPAWTKKSISSAPCVSAAGSAGSGAGQFGLPAATKASPLVGKAKSGQASGGRRKDLVDDEVLTGTN